MGLRPIDHCTLQRAHDQHRTPTASDHKGKCGHICCAACGGDRLWKLTKGFKDISQHIVAKHLSSYVLGWRPIGTHSTNTERMTAFFRSAQKLKQMIRERTKSKAWNRVLGVFGVSQIAFLKGNEGILNPHLHLCIVFEGNDLAAVRKHQNAIRMEVESIWKELEGHGLKCERGGSIAKLAGYLSKPSVNKGRLRASIRVVHDRLLDHVERDLGAQALVVIKAGLFDGRNGKFISYQLSALRPKLPAGDKHLIHPKDCADAPAGIQIVGIGLRCPACHGRSDDVVRNGRASSGRQRWKCKSCGHSTTTDKAYPLNKLLFPETSYQRRDVRRMKALRKRGRTYREIADVFGIDPRTVKRVLSLCQSQ